MSGLATLFTLEYFEAASSKLNPGGVFLQWVHTYQIDWPTLSIIGRTFKKAFPGGVMLSADPLGVGGDLLLVGLKGKKRLDPEVAEQTLRHMKRSSNVEIRDHRLFFKMIVSEDLEQMFGNGLVNTDSVPVIEFAAPRRMYFSDSTIREKIESRMKLGAVTQKVVAEVEKDIDFQIDFAAYAMSLNVLFTDVDLQNASAQQKDEYFQLFENYCRRNLVDYSKIANEDLRQRCFEIQLELVERNFGRIPRKELSYGYLADLYYYQGMMKKSAENYSIYLRSRPNDLGAQYRIARALEELSRLGEAMTHYREAIEIEPEFAQAHYRMGLLHDRLGELEKSRLHLLEAIRIDPLFAEAHYNLGALYARRGGLAPALEHLEKALELRPGAAEIHYNLGWVLAKMGDLSRARKHLKKALSIKPDMADAGILLENIEKTLGAGEPRQ